jgi:hypothetical protein
MQFTKLFLLAGFLFITHFLGAQETPPANYCGLREYSIPAWLREFQANPGAYAHLRNNNNQIQIPLTIHIIGRSDGSGYYSTTDLMQSLCYLNELFEPLNMNFFIKGNIRYHNNTVWYNHETFQTGNFIYNATRVTNTINCYIDNNAAGNCGYATLGGDRIFLRNSCIRGRNSTWAHEMGHSLTLAHTFFGWEGPDPTYQAGSPAPNVVTFTGNPVQVERVDRSNCTQSADGFCGTPTDYLNYIWNCNGQRLSPVEQIDPTGARFRSEGKYTMSYSNCSDEFSDDQMTAMRTHTLAVKNLMIDNNQYPLLSNRKPINVYPVQDQEVHHQNVRIEWEPIANADSFIVEVSRFNVFGSLEFRGVTTQNFVVIPNLIENRQYFYRVMPISKSDFCVSYSDVVRFRAVINTSTFELEGNSFRIFPNLLNETRTIQLEGNFFNPLDVRFDLINMEGKTIYTENRFFVSGSFREPLELPAVPAGFYFLRATSAGGSSTLKLYAQ